jgi:hypothetical protein
MFGICVSSKRAPIQSQMVSVKGPMAEPCARFRPEIRPHAYQRRAPMQPTTTPSDVEAMMPFVLPHMQFLNEVSKLPADTAHRDGAGRIARQISSTGLYLKICH